jgi:hypothetical protein
VYTVAKVLGAAVHLRKMTAAVLQELPLNAAADLTQARAAPKLRGLDAFAHIWAVCGSQTCHPMCATTVKCVGACDFIHHAPIISVMGMVISSSRRYEHNNHLSCGVAQA